jgi:hypothetical protein
MESIVDYNGFYEENVPGAGKFRVEKGGAGVANYVTSTSFKIWDPQRNTYNENLVYDSFLPKERNLEQYREDQMNNLYEVDRYNTEAFNADYDINY